MFACAVRRLLDYSTAVVAAAVFGLISAAPPASAAVLAARGATVPQAPGQIPRLHAALAAGSIPLVYVCDGINQVLAYDATYAGGSPRTISTAVETITGVRGPSGLAVDSVGNLYVVESMANDVKVFAPGSVTPFRTLAGGSGATASSIALDGNGNVYVGTNSDRIWVYRAGAITPTTVLSDPSILYITEIAADRSGNVFVSYVRKVDDYYSVGAFPASISLRAGFFVPLPELTVATIESFGIAVDSRGDLLVQNSAYADGMGTSMSDRRINVYRPANPTPGSQYAFTDRSGLDYFAITGVTNPSIIIAKQRGLYVTMQNLTTGSLELQFLIPAPYASASVAAYPAEPLGTW